MSPPFGHSFAASNNGECVCSATQTCQLNAYIAPPTSPDDAVKQALLAVVQVWLDRLQSMAVVVSNLFMLSRGKRIYARIGRIRQSSARTLSDLSILLQ